MPGAGVEGAVEVGDQALLGEVELDLSEQFRPYELPQVRGCETVTLRFPRGFCCG